MRESKRQAGGWTEGCPGRRREGHLVEELLFEMSRENAFFLARQQRRKQLGAFSASLSQEIFIPASGSHFFIDKIERCKRLS